MLPKFKGKLIMLDGGSEGEGNTPIINYVNKFNPVDSASNNISDLPF